MAKCGEHGIRLSCMNPAFLNSNSTSHTWPFSAVAELVDNASDPGVSAKQMWIDVVEEKGQLCLTFTDNGCGMTPNKLHKMLSFGFTEKGLGKDSQRAIGVYGNGFKSGSMRLGRDALIFTKNGGCQSVGMMSQTYLGSIKAQAIIVPIVPFNQQTKSQVVTQDSENSLKAILENSIITSVEEIHKHFDSIPSKKGTKILIWNIRRSKDGKPEMDFETDETDFRLPPIQIQEIKRDLGRSGSMRHEQNIPEMQYSLRAYLSILYLKPRTQIVLRGKKNIPRLISKGLGNIEHDVYSPSFSKDKVKVVFGTSLGKKDHYGIMLYHKNRLIKAYEKVGCQVKTSGQRAGGGVIGVIECNFLKPAHNKQDFEYTKEYRLTLSALGVKLNDYWKALTQKQPSGRALQATGQGEGKEESESSPTWLQCEECLKWRSIPPGHYKQVPESWSCSQNPKPRYRSCSVPEEAEEEPSAPTYQRSYKKQEFTKGRKRKSTVNWEKEQLDEDNTFQSFTRSEQRTPDHPEDLSLPHTNNGARASEAETVEGSGEGSAAEADADEGDKVEPSENTGEDQKPEDGEENVRNDRGTNTETSSCKWKAEPLFPCADKKPCLQTRWPEAGSIEDTCREEETEMGEMSPEETTSDRVDGDGDATEGGAPAHRSGASPRGGTPQSGPSPRRGDQATYLRRLAELEKEVRELRSLLGLRVQRTTQDTMTTARTEDALGTPCSREMGCQTDAAEARLDSQSSPSCSLVLVSGEQRDFVQSALAQGVGEQPEQSRTKRRAGSPSWKHLSDADSRSSQECLRLIRNNVVVLLTALLPQVDLSDISMETADVDSILEQIIEVNSLKL